MYYEVARADGPSLVPRIRAMQAKLAGDARLARLARRTDAAAAGTTETWMEVYEGVSADFESRLAALVDAHGLAGSTGVRHVERFEAIA